MTGAERAAAPDVVRPLVDADAVDTAGVKVALAAQADSVQRLHVSLEQLVERLGPVLRPDVPHEARAANLQGGAANLQGVPQSPVADALDQTHDGINAARYTVLSLLERIDL